jgi:DNA invertase Pin-like site-specific DNA recombinase
MRKDQPTLIGNQLFKFKETLAQRQKYVKNEYQSYGLDLAKELGDWKNRSLYIRLSKNTDRKILEQARYFVKDQNPGSIKTPYKLFMWKLRQLKEAKI